MARPRISSMEVWAEPCTLYMTLQFHPIGGYKREVQVCVTSAASDTRNLERATKRSQ
ncbi:hypothetical protein J6590_078912 [Homalodisca vitripennis]|nr:hypothetical protein J6590_078912 [Homalodisca vitripennis]